MNNVLLAGLMAAGLSLLGGCNTTHEVEVKPVQTKHEIEIKPIYITVDVNVKVDKQLDSFFDFEEEKKTSG